MNRPERNSSLDTTTGPDTLDEIQQHLDDFFAINDAVPANIRLTLSIAVAEIGANIIEHAGAGKSLKLHMAVELLPNEVRISFIDDGVPAEVDLDAASLPDDDAERGRGLAIAKAALGQLTYHRNAANHWTLVSQRFGN